jgi:hypothetical protein
MQSDDRKKTTEAVISGKKNSQELELLELPVLHKP